MWHGLSLLSIWDWIEATAIFFVLLGVAAGFWVSRSKYKHVTDPNDLMPVEFRKQEWELRRKKREDKWEYVLIFGLALELFVFPHHIREVLQLKKQILLLEAQAEPRTITFEQVTNFLFLTERLPKIPITVCTDGRSSDESYAFQFRTMLDKAGYGPPTNSETWGIKRDPSVYVARYLGLTNWPHVFLMCYGTNNWAKHSLAMEVTNGISRPILPVPVDTDGIYNALRICLNQIGIETAWMNTTGSVGPGECEFFIPIKNN